MNRISQHQAEVERLNKSIGICKLMILQQTIKIFKAESKNIIARATDELKKKKKDYKTLWENLESWILTPLQNKLWKQFFNKIFDDTRIEQEIKEWQTHLEWLEKQ